jgi:tetratricopeptide (TPR) repeat protein
MFAEGDREADMLAQIGAPASAGLLKARSILARGDPARAAKIYDSLLAISPDSLPVVNTGVEITGGIALLAGGGGRLEAARRLNRAWLADIPLDSGVGPGNLRMSKAELIRSIDALVAAEAGLPEVREFGSDFQRIAARNAGRDTAALRRYMTSLATGFLSSFLATRDSSTLKTILASVDTTTSSTWHVVDAQLALMRGDTARARMRVERHYRRPEQVEFRGDNGAIRTYAWADLLSRLGDPGQAVRAFALLDSAERSVPHPGLQVRSFAERGALYQRLGDPEKAAEFYRKFIDAWKDADPGLQPMVDRARAALEALPNAAR